MPRTRLIALLVLLAPMVSRHSAIAEDAVLLRGQARFQPALMEDKLPELFRLPAHEFPYELVREPSAAKNIEIFSLTFPSPVETPDACNNTVHCEYFRPSKPNGKQPAVVVLHILGGDFDLCRLFGRTFAHHGICALFLKLPYYGPRSVPGGRRRMVTIDPHETAAGMRQGVLDIRRAAAWMAQQDEVDADRLGVFGISLGGITGALAMAAEPRFRSAALMLAGGDIGAVSWDTHEKEVARAREHWLAQGKTREQFIDALKPVDPVQYGDLLRGRRVLMINARYDEVIPKPCTESLWRACGQPQIVWFDCGHYSAARFLFEALASVTKFFREE